MMGTYVLCSECNRHRNLEIIILVPYMHHVQDVLKNSFIYL